MGSMKGMTLLIVAILAVAGMSGYMLSKAPEDWDDYIPPSNYEYILSDGFVSQYNDGSNPLPDYIVDGDMSIDAYFREPDMIFGMVSLDVEAEGEYYLESQFYNGWYFDDRMGDKDIEEFSIEKIDTIDGEKDCITYIEDALSQSGFKIKFYVDKDECIIYRILVQTISPMKDSKCQVHDVSYIFSVFDVVNYEVHKGRYVPEEQKRIKEIDASGTYEVYNEGYDPVIFEANGIITIDMLGSFAWNGGKGHAYLVRAEMSSDDVSYSLQHYIMLDNRGHLLNGTDYGDSWKAVQYNWTYYVSTKLGEDTDLTVTGVTNFNGDLSLDYVSHIYYVLDGSDLQTIKMTAYSI